MKETLTDTMILDLSFIDYVKESHQDRLSEIVEYGSHATIMGGRADCFGELQSLYEQFKKDIWIIIGDYCEEIGDRYDIVKWVGSNKTYRIINDDDFKCVMVWIAYDLVAKRLAKIYGLID